MVIMCCFVSNTQQLQDAADAPVDPVEYKWHFSRVPVRRKKRQNNHIYRFRHMNGGHQNGAAPLCWWGTWASSRITQNSLNCCERTGAPKVAVNHLPAPDAGLLCWYVHTLITSCKQAEKQSWSCPSFFWELFRLLKLTLLWLFLWWLWVGHLIWAPCVRLTHTHLSLPESVAAFAEALGNYQIYLS